MRFDAYAGTVREREFDYVAQVLAGSLGAIVVKGQPRRRYGDVLDLEVAGRQAAWVGFDRGNGLVYFEGKGETSPGLVHAVRAHFPKHSVARVDVCEDYDQAGAFDQLVGLVRAHKGERVEGGFVRLPDNPEDGRTWAAGVRGGVGYLRVYEAGKMRDRAHFNRPHWVRAEGEFRPHYARDKQAVAAMQPVEVWGLAAWTQRVGEVLAQVAVPRFEPQSREYTHDRTTAYLARTYRRHFEEILRQAEGDLAAIGIELAKVWADDDQVQAALKAARH